MSGFLLDTDADLSSTEARLLISQAVAEELTIVSGDRKFAGYPGLDVLEI